MFQSAKQEINSLKEQLSSKLEWFYTNPTKSGYYIVETKTSFGNINTMKSFYNHKTNRWSFNNQTFYRYLN